MKLNRELPTLMADLVDQGALFFCSHSGGKDSQAMYLYLRDKIPADQLVLVHADLSDVEWEGVQDHIKNTTEGKLHVVHNHLKDFRSMVRKRGMFPSPQYRQCTNDLKVGPINKLIRKMMADRECTIGVNCTGIRAEESPNRAKKDEVAYNKKLTIFERYDCPKGSTDKKGRVKRLKDYTTPKRGERLVYDWLPVFDWTVEEVFQAIKASGQRPHWAYEVGMTRLSCCFCIMASKGDLKTSAQHNPELLDKIADLEEEIGHTMFMKSGAPIGIKDYIGDYDNHEAPNLFELLTQEEEVA